VAVLRHFSAAAQVFEHAHGCSNLLTHNFHWALFTVLSVLLGLFFLCLRLLHPLVQLWTIESTLASKSENHLTAFLSASGSNFYAVSPLQHLRRSKMSSVSLMSSLYAPTTLILAVQSIWSSMLRILRWPTCLFTCQQPVVSCPKLLTLLRRRLC